MARQLFKISIASNGLNSSYIDLGTDVHEDMYVYQVAGAQVSFYGASDTSGTLGGAVTERVASGTTTAVTPLIVATTASGQWVHLDQSLPRFVQARVTATAANGTDIYIMTT